MVLCVSVLFMFVVVLFCLFLVYICMYVVALFSFLCLFCVLFYSSCVRLLFPFIFAFACVCFCVCLFGFCVLCGFLFCYWYSFRDVLFVFGVCFGSFIVLLNLLFLLCLIFCIAFVLVCVVCRCVAWFVLLFYICLNELCLCLFI